MFQAAGEICELIFCFLGNLKCDLGEAEKAMFQEVQ
jgi:hypothetical protein